MGTRNGCHLCPTCGTQLGRGHLCCTLPMLGLGVPRLEEMLGLRADGGGYKGHSKTCCSPGHPLVGSQASASCSCT